MLERFGLVHMGRRKTGGILNESASDEVKERIRIAVASFHDLRGSTY